MVTTVASNVFVCKGKDGEPGLKYSKNGQSVQFNVSWKVYDPNAEGESRFMFYHVKAFGQVCERIKRMNVMEGSCINFVGRLDEDKWEDRNTGGVNRRNTIILSDIEYAKTGAKSKDGEGADGGTAVQGNGGQMNNQQPAAPQQAAPQNMSQGYGNQPQQGMPGQNVPQGYGNQPQQAAPRQNAPQGYGNQPQQTAPQPVGNAASFSGFAGFTPFEGSNMFPA